MTARAPVDDLDPAVVGMALIKLAAASAHMGHDRLIYTIRDYMDCGDDNDPDEIEAQFAEARFIKAVFTKGTREIVREWFANDKFKVGGYALRDSGL